MLAIAFENPVPGGVGCANPCPPPPPGSGTQAILRDAFMSTGHVTLTDNTFVFGLHEMPDPSDGVTDLGIGFNGWSVSYSASAFSSQLPVSRRGNTWTITATTQAAQLIKFSNNGKTQTAAGTFVMPTQITIICPSC